MGKPQKANNKKPQAPKPNKKKNQLAKLNSDDDEQVDDVMAWGRKKQNYYREDEDEYSQLSEQQKQAKQIYQNQYDNYLNDEDLYEVPKDKTDNEPAKKASYEDQFDQNLNQEQTLPQQYVRQQLEWIIQLFKDLEFYQENDLLKIYQKLLKSYLTVIVSIKELKIPYIQYHPIVPIAVDIKTKISKLMKKLTINDTKNNAQGLKAGKSSKKQQNHEQQQLSQPEDFEDNQSIEDQSQNGSQEQNLSDQIEGIQWNDHKKNIKSVNKTSNNQQQKHKKGMQYYNQMKSQLQQVKKLKKKQKKVEKQLAKKPAFKQVNQNQGRFASQLILKNKGLIKKRKKIQGNSRVKLRKKFEKKKAIHRAQTGHFIRQNPGRSYEGQANIRYGKLAGVRLN